MTSDEACKLALSFFHLVLQHRFGLHTWGAEGGGGKHEMQGWKGPNH